MRRFCIDSSLLGSKRHIVGDVEGFVWSDSVPRDAWHLTGEVKSSSSVKCLDTLMKMTARHLPEPPQRYLTAMKTLVTGSISQPIPWQHALPQSVFREYFTNLTQETKDAFSDLPFDFYETAWLPGSRVLNALKPVRVDLDLLTSLSSSSGQNAPALESFRPKRSGFAQPVTYDRFGTRTGRLTVAEGPNILVLKKEARQIMKSSYDNGVICSLDFRALEARVVLAEGGRHSDAGDMYDDLSKSLFSGTVSRDTVKVAVLAELYGISRNSLRARLKVSDASLDYFVNGIRTHFRVEDLKKRLKREAETTGKIRNRFGRPLDAPQDNLLINTYAQSTGADVSLLGFDTVLQKLGSDGIRPLFVLHDAIILDVRDDRLEDVKNSASVAIPTYDFHFPLKFEQVSSS